MDWTIAITILATVGTIANAMKKRWCFWIWLITNTAWLAYNLYLGLIPQALFFLVNLVFSVVGLCTWKKTKANQ